MKRYISLAGALIVGTVVAQKDKKSFLKGTSIDVTKQAATDLLQKDQLILQGAMAPGLVRDQAVDEELTSIDDGEVTSQESSECSS